MTTTVQRAIERFAPNFRDVAERPDTVQISRLVAARTAIAEGPDWTDASTFDRDLATAKAAVDELDKMIQRRRAAQAEAASTARPVAGQGDFHPMSTSHTDAPLLRDATTGRAIRSYSAREPVASDGGRPDYGVGDMVRAAVTGDWSRVPSSVRAGSAGVGASGGFLIPSELSSWVLDLARPQARTLQAGARTIPMEHGNISIAKITADPQATWRSENAPFASSQSSFGLINLTAKSLGVIVPISLELLMSASNVNSLIEGQLTKALALQLDAAAISGDGTASQPWGILNQIPASNTFAATGALTSATAYPLWSQAISSILNSNAELEKISILHNSGVSGVLDTLVDTLGQPLRPLPNFAAIKNAGREFIANGILSSGTPATTFSMVGDFSQLLYGMQQNLMIEVSREGSYVDASGTSTNAFSNGQVLIRAGIWCDVAVLRPDFFAVVNGIQV